MLGKVGALLIGVGIGVGVGLLIAPASGEETRADIANKVSAFGASGQWAYRIMLKIDNVFSG